MPTDIEFKQLSQRMAAFEQRLAVQERLIKQLLENHGMEDADLAAMELQAEYDLALEATDRGDYKPLQAWQRKVVRRSAELITRGQRAEGIGHRAESIGHRAESRG